MKYTENHKLGEIISEHYQLLLVMSRFGIPLGFGDDNIGKICEKNKVDCETFLAVINFIVNGDASGTVSPVAIVKFLENSHDYYLNFFFPNLRRKLIEALNISLSDKLSLLILKFLDDYILEVSRHFSSEGNSVFRYAKQLSNGTLESDKVNIIEYSRQHEKIDSKIQELKQVMIKYYPDSGRTMALNSVLYDIFSYEEDLKLHCEIEDNLFVPAILKLEEKRKL